MSSTGSSIPRKPAGRYHHGDLRRTLIDASLELVRQRGPSGFTLAEICRAAGVSQADRTGKRRCFTRNCAR